MSAIDNEEKETQEEDIAGQEGKIGVITKDTRLEKEMVDISSGDIEEDVFDRLCRNIEKSKHDTYNLLQEAIRRGYTKVDIATGEVSK